MLVWEHAQTMGLVWGTVQGVSRRAPHRLWLLPLPLLVLEVCSRVTTEWILLMLPVPPPPLTPRLWVVATCCALAVCTVPQQKAVHLAAVWLVLFRWVVVVAAWVVAVGVVEVVGGLRGSLTARGCVAGNLFLVVRAVTAVSRPACWHLYTSLAPCILLPQLIFLALYGSQSSS